MPGRVKATKTVNPLHFEDLEPHRFEDLVRRLLYAFRDWQDIEATGRSGSDEGFDVRAWESTAALTNVGDEGEEGEHLLEGNLWQIQGKREKSISPAHMAAIIKEDVDINNPPYGYILAAATNISKKTYDVFREQLRRKGVHEFHFWGKDYLEDQLARPENDEILFTFFGISLSPRRRARAIEIKFGINNKNKMLKLIGSDAFGEGSMSAKGSFLLRDIKDQHYPYAGEYADFDKHRRWEEHEAVQLDVTGAVFRAREWYAYVDAQKKEWDFTKTVDLSPRRHDLDDLNARRGQDAGKKIEHFWRHLPFRCQAKFTVYGLVKYEDMLIIDDKGDPYFAMPHIFLDFSDTRGPFSGRFGSLFQSRQEPIDARELERDFKRVKISPETFPEPGRGKTHELAMLGLTEAPLRRLEYSHGCNVLYSFDDKLASLSESDIIHIPQLDGRGADKHVEVTHVREKMSVAALTAAAEYLMQELEEHAGRKVAAEEQVTAYEVCEVYTWGPYLAYQDSA